MKVHLGLRQVLKQVLLMTAMVESSHLNHQTGLSFTVPSSFMDLGAIHAGAMAERPRSHMGLATRNRQNHLKGRSAFGGGTSAFGLRMC